MLNLSEVRKTLAVYFTQPIVKLLAKTPITPSILTWFGFFLAVVAGVLVASGYAFVAGLVTLFGGFFDMLDGALARHTNRETSFGAVLDSTLDRLAESALLLGILVFYAREQSLVGILLVGFTLVGSLLVSYIRARTEALGIEGKVGLFTRTERVIILALGLLLNRFDYALIIALAIISVFSFFTIVQRMLNVWKRTS